jgi:hypothetical protein
LKRDKFGNANKNVLHSSCKSEKNDSQQAPHLTEANSYKFARPRIYVQNGYESADISAIDHLRYISANVGPKERTPAYNHFLDRQLQLSRPRNEKKSKGKKEVSLNNVDFSSPTLKLATLKVSDLPIKALVDTGSTHCLMSVKTFQKIQNLPFTPLKVHMKVAGSVLHDNVVGSTICSTSFKTSEGEVTIPLTFLIAHALNGYEAILGATLLMNPEMTMAITPTHLCLTPEYNSANILLETSKKKMQGNFMRCDNVVISPGMTLNLAANVSPPFSSYAKRNLETTTVSGDYAILNCFQTSLESVQCTVKNSSNKKLTLNPQSYFGLAFENNPHFHASEINSHASEINSHISNLQEKNAESEFSDAKLFENNPDFHTSEINSHASEINSHISNLQEKNAESEFSDAENICESIDDQIISEHQMFDPSDLDKRFKYTDCEINPNLKPEIRKRLDKILHDNQTVFAKSKLDVGKFPDFTVSLEIDEEIPAEKQRFMSEEKLAYCEKTFDEFEKLGLVQECHSPKTVSNLLLVPKYVGFEGSYKSICLSGPS